MPRGEAGGRTNGGEIVSEGGSHHRSQRRTRYLGALWMSALARKHPDLRLVTMGPGNTARTDAMRSMGTFTRILMSRVLIPYVSHALHIGQALENGAKRLVDAVTQDGFRNGVFSRKES
jgi:hypothetical protein